MGARAHSLEDVAFLAEAGFAFAEIDWKEPGVVRAQIRGLAALQKQHGIAYLAHGPNEEDPFGIESMTAFLEPRVTELLSLAPQLGINLYTQHLWLDPRFVKAEVIARKIDLLAHWAFEAQKVGVTFCIENLSETPEDFAPAFERSPLLSMTLDVGHGEILSPSNTAFGFIRRFLDRIRHVHLHDNRGGNHVRDDLHLPVGEGSIDFRGILKALQAAGYNAGLSFEVKLEHVNRCRETIQAIL